MTQEEYYDRMFMRECMKILNKELKYWDCELITYFPKEQEYAILWGDYDFWNMSRSRERELVKEMNGLFGWPWADSYTKEHKERDKRDSIRMCEIEMEVSIDYHLWPWAYDRYLELKEKYETMRQSNS